MPRKFTVTHPDGTVSKRQSKSREYTYAIEVTPADAEAYAAAREQMAAVQETEAARLVEAVAAGNVVVKRKDEWRGVTRGDLALKGTEVKSARSSRHGGPGHYHSVMAQRCVLIDGTWYYRTLASHNTLPVEDVEWPDSFLRDSDEWVTVRGRAMVLESGREQARSLIEAAENNRKLAAEARTGTLPEGLDNYYVARWSARRDLAEKAMSEFDYVIREGRSRRVVPVDES